MMSAFLAVGLLLCREKTHGEKSARRGGVTRHGAGWRSRSGFLEKIFHIAFAVDNTNDAKRARVFVNDKIGTERPEENIPVRKILAFVAHARHLDELMKARSKSSRTASAASTLSWEINSQIS